MVDICTLSTCSPTSMAPLTPMSGTVSACHKVVITDKGRPQIGRPLSLRLVGGQSDFCVDSQSFHSPERRSKITLFGKLFAIRGIIRIGVTIRTPEVG